MSTKIFTLLFSCVPEADCIGTSLSFKSSTHGLGLAGDPLRPVASRGPGALKRLLWGGGYVNRGDRCESNSLAAATDTTKIKR